MPKTKNTNKKLIIEGEIIAGLILAIAILAFFMYSHKKVVPVIPAYNISPKEISRGDTTKKQIIFTFDGGGGSQSADAILNILKKHGVKGSFFLTGKWVHDNPDLVKRMAAEGHELFNHTYNHPHLPELSNVGIKDELDSVENELKLVASVYAKPYFRPPYGDRDDRVLSTAFADGYESIYWTFDARDWEETEGMTAEEVTNRILNNASPGAIVLMHIGDNITGQVLDNVFTTLEGRGYKMVSLTQGL